MTQEVAPPIEDRLRAALTNIAEQVSIDPLPAMWSDEDERRTPSRRVRVFAVAALATSIAVGVAITVNTTTSANHPRPTPATVASSFVDDGPLDAVRTYRGGLISLLPPESTSTHITALEAYQAYVANKTYPWRHEPPNPHLVLAESTISDYGETHANGTVTPFIDHRLTWIVTFDHVPPAGTRVGKSSGPPTTPPAPLGRRGPSNFTVLVFVDASTGEVLDAQGADASPGPALPPLACPARAPRLVAPHQIRGTDSWMVPGGGGAAVLACRYYGLNQHQPAGTLASSAQFAPGPIQTALNAQPAIPKDAVFHCPIDFGAKILLIFGYDDARLTISIDPSGCRFAGNGDRVIHMEPATLARLEAVLGRDPSP